jgi:septal ring factor EnvC (AmiA/AmiB activator)
MTTSRPGPNDVLPCGTESARRRHQARGEDCAICGNPTPTAARIALLEADLAETRSYLEAAETELATTKHRLASTEAELAVAEASLETATSRLAAVEDELAVANKRLAAVDADLARTRAELGAIIETDHGALAIEVKHLRAALGIRPQRVKAA